MSGITETGSWPGRSRPPHGGADRNIAKHWFTLTATVAPRTGGESKQHHQLSALDPTRSPPQGIETITGRFSGHALMVAPLKG